MTTGTRSPAPWLLYGATGYTGRRIARHARTRGATPILAGRDGVALRRLAADLGTDYRVFDLANPDRVDAALRDVPLVLNCAGPFAATAIPLVAACFRSGCHYLDVNGEADVTEDLRALDTLAAAAGVMVLPGAGFTSVASEAAAVLAARQLPDASELRIGLSGIEVTSRGSVRTMVRGAGGVRVRRGGALVTVPPGTLQREFDFGHGPRAGVALSLSDTVTCFHSTGIATITVYIEATRRVAAWERMHALAGGAAATPAWQAMMRTFADLLPVEGEQPADRAVVVAEVTNAAGASASARIETDGVYSFTDRAAVELCLRTLSGAGRPGFRSPSQVLAPGDVAAWAAATASDR